MYRKIINRYVQAIVDRLPFWVKKRAERDLKKMMYQMLWDYCEGERPVGRDVRAIIEELGTPSEVADQYYYKSRRPRKRTERIQWRKRMAYLQMAVTILAVCMIFIGVTQLFLGVGADLKMFMAGTVMAVILVVTKIAVPDVSFFNEFKIKQKR